MKVNRRLAFSPVGDKNIRSRMLSELKGEMIGVGQDGKFFSKVKER